MGAVLTVLLGIAWQPGIKVLCAELEKGWAARIDECVHVLRGGSLNTEGRGPCESELLWKGSLGEVSLELDVEGNYASKLVTFQTKGRAP